jgi:hypothetical protein
MISTKISANGESLTQFEVTFVNGGRNSTELPVPIHFFSSSRIKFALVLFFGLIEKIEAI